MSAISMNSPDDRAAIEAILRDVETAIRSGQIDQELERRRPELEKALKALDDARRIDPKIWDMVIDI
jgi:hypothetical protein